MGLRGPVKGAIRPYESLTAKQQRFIEEFMTNGHNASQAYRDAGYWVGESQGAVRVSAYKLRHHPSIEAEIRSRMEKVVMSEQEALARQSEVGRFDVGEILTQDAVECPHCGGEVIEAGEWRVDLDLAKKLGVTDKIKKMSYDRNGRLNVEFRDPDAAQRTMLQAQGAFNKKDTSDGLAGLAALLAAAKANQVEQAKGDG